MLSSHGDAYTAARCFTSRELFFYLGLQKDSELFACWQRCDELALLAASANVIEQRPALQLYLSLKRHTDGNAAAVHAFAYYAG
jgi:hypothetical protein